MGAFTSNTMLTWFVTAVPHARPASGATVLKKSLIARGIASVWSPNVFHRYSNAVKRVSQATAAAVRVSTPSLANTARR